jgi:hypothetical protein
MFSNLDIYEDKIDADTEQGASFLEYKKEYVKSGGNNHSLLSESSSSDIGSIIEAIDGSDSISGKQSALEKNLSDNQTIFYALLSQYTTAYNIYITKIKNNNYSNNSADEAQLLALNNELIRLAETIVSEAQQLQTTDEALKLKIEKKQQDIILDINKLQGQKQKIVKFYDTDSVDGAIETTSLNMNSIYAHYIVYVFIAITLIVFIFNISINPEADVMKSIILLVALLAVYIITRYI